MYDEFFERARALRQAGVPFATATVVRAEKPTSGKPGDRAIITRDGAVHGWVGGSCAQPTVAEFAARAILDGEPRLIRLSPEPGSKPVPEGIEEVPMTCFSGGTLDIFIEPQQPAPHLLIIGSLPVAQSLARLGKAMSYRVTAVDATGSDTMSHTDEVLRDIADIPSRVGPLTFAVVATHGDYDEPALKAVLGTAAPYVALVASRKRGEAVLESLVMDGLDDAACERVRFPAGLDIQARRGDEIAVSILAEIVQIRRNLGEVRWNEDSTATSHDAAEATARGGSGSGDKPTHSVSRQPEADEVAHHGLDGAATAHASDGDDEGRPRLGLVALGMEPPRRATTAQSGPALHASQPADRAAAPDPAAPGSARDARPRDGARAVPHHAPSAVEAGAAIDPICHMTVQVASAQHTYDFEGETYYFCCGGCRMRFAKDPHAYIATG